MKKHSFRDAEAKCEATFSYNCDNWWHLYTPGKETPVIFQDDSDFRYSMNLMARCSTEFQELVIVAFEIMNNHIHIVLAGEEEKIKEFFMAFRRRLVRSLSQNHYMKPFDCFEDIEKHYRLCQQKWLCRKSGSYSLFISMGNRCLLFQYAAIWISKCQRFEGY